MAYPAVTSFTPQADTLTYETFFGLKEKPFSLNSDPRFLYESASHAATFQNLLGGIRRREGLLVLTGEIGTGKTTLCRAVLDGLGRRTFSSFVPDPFASREDLLKTLLIDFGVMTIQDFTTGPLEQASRTELSYLLAGFLESVDPLDAFVVAIIDEAQNMSLPLIEETRILADSFGGRGYLQLVFVGQPELHAKLKLPEMRQVDQRICGYSHLAPLRRDEVAGYIQHRLHVAGNRGERSLFSPEVIEVIHQRSGGVPRLINRISDRALHVAYLRRMDSVAPEILDAALDDIGPTTLTPTWEAMTFPGQALGSRLEPAAVAWRQKARQPGVVTASRVQPAKPVEDVNLSKQLDEQSSPRDDASAVQRPALDEFATDPSAPADKTQVAARTSLFRAALNRLQPRRRAEACLRRLGRVWVRRGAVAAGCVVALNAAAVGASHLSSALTASPELPTPPVPPLLMIPRVVAPIAPSLDVPPVTPRPVITASGRYLVSVGLFADRERAEWLVAELAAAGLRASHRPFQLRTRLVQRVVLGPFADRAAAVADLLRLRQLGGYDDAHVFELTKEAN